MDVRSNNSLVGAYLHIPFCDTKCIYCDFFSLTNTDQADRFYTAIGDEISIRAAKEPVTTPLTSIFFGGGTPSLAEPSQLKDLISRIKDHWPIHPDCEITLEANPGTLSPEKLERLLSAGFNRISMGVQSFYDDDLLALSRIHSSTVAKQAVSDARQAGFSNISIDLIFGLPAQTSERWENNLEVALTLPISHISAYNLIVEEKTPLFHLVGQGKITVPDNDACATLYETTIRVLEAAGFAQYEVSNFAKPGFESVHNSTYWLHQPWLAFGPSAFGFGNGIRYKNVRNLSKYCEMIESGHLPVDETEEITGITGLNERLMLAVRTTLGLSLEPYWNELPEKNRADLRIKFEVLQKSGYIGWFEPVLRATPEGLRFGDYLATELLI